MNTPARYITKQLLTVFAISLAVIFSIAMGDKLIHFLEKAAIGQLPGHMVLYVVLLRMPGILQLVIPFAFYVAILLSFGRLYSTQEMVILQSGGMSTATLLKWLSSPVLALTFGVGLLSLWIAPSAQFALEESMDELRTQTGFAALQPGTFRSDNKNDWVIYSEGLADDDQTILNVFVQRTLATGEEVTVWAERGRKDPPNAQGQQLLSLYNGRRYVGQPGAQNFEVMTFEEFHIALNVDTVIERVTDVEATPTLALLDSAEHQAELHWRIAMPLFFLIVSGLAIGVAPVKPRQGPYAQIAPGLLWIVGYYIALIANRWAITEAQIPSIFGLWLVHLIFAAIAIRLIKQIGRPAAV
ncbi:LPS export ABC transporter permease LptF [Pseudomonadales bacterium]|nr:LPS export ABC transporter permease LptF [Pseudomonadales bacterium]